jgi:hypothetical protein
MKHSKIQNELYDYLLNELPGDQRRDVAEHLASCRACSEALQTLRQTLAAFPATPHQPCDEHDGLFWQSLSGRIEQQIEMSGRPRRNAVSRYVDAVRSFVTLRPGYGVALVGALATIAVSLFLLRFSPAVRQPVAGSATPAVDSTVLLARYQTQQRISRYFDKSKMLLVGIANMKTDGENMDLSAERNLSRSLVHEARFLKHQPMDERSAKLIRDLDKILIELANLEEDYDVPDVELIRGGIHQENLLFKIRMAENSLPQGGRAPYDTSGRANTIY